MDVDGESFRDLLHQAEQLTAEMDSGGELPRIERNLTQILESGQRLWTRTAQIGQESADIKASILLGSKGYDVPKISQKLEGLSTVKTFEPLEPIRDTDIQGFLKNERENALLAVIEQTRKQTLEEAEKRHWECLENEWEREKQKILNSLIGSDQGILDIPQETENILEDSISMHGRSALDSVEMAYARQIFVYNEQIIRGGIQPNMVEMFTEVATKLDDKNLLEFWDTVRYMVDVSPASQSNIHSMRLSEKMQRSFVKQALKYLEQSYKDYVTKTIYDNLQTAQLGGIPGTLQMVLSYLKVRQIHHTASFEDGVVDGQPLWPIVYFCLKCGDHKAALAVVNRVAHTLGDFASFLHEYVNSPDHKLSPSNETKIRLQYRRVIKNSRDPYKRAVYCVIGQCDYKEDHSELADKIENYLWLKLTQLQFGEGEDQLTLTKLQMLLYEDYGEAHFSAYQQPFLYVKVLLLTAQFEAAIEFLSRMDGLRCHGVHLALVLYGMKLLILSPTIQAQLLSRETLDSAPYYRLNLARLIMLYTRKFDSTDPREALQYFYFLRDLRKSSGESLYMSCVSELVQETREFEMLLGRLERDGTRRPGAIDKFHGDTQQIIELVAKETETKGLFEDSVKLYDLAGKHEKVLELMNKLIGQVVSQSSTAQSSRDRLKALAVNIAERYQSVGKSVCQATSSTFYLLLDLLTFFDMYHSTTYDQALEIIQHLKLLPLTTDMVEQKVNDFRHYSDEVRRSLPDILLATMNILLNKYKSTRSTGTHQSPGVKSLTQMDGGKDSYLGYLRGQARALIMFAGMLPYRMPGDTNARLVQMEVLMN